MTTVLLYTRLSKEDLHSATARQEMACRAFADLREWTVGGVFTDTDASAYLPRARRPAFEALIDAVTDRACEGVLVWKLDRLVRRPADFERLWDITEKRGVFVASVVEPVDSSTPLGLALLRILVALAGLESATTGIRVRERKRQVAIDGKPPATKAYGWNETWDAIDETEAAVIREAARRVLAGERVELIARDFQRRGILSATGKPWHGAVLARMLRHPRLVGDRAYQDEVVARDCWPPILDRATWAQVQLTLNHPQRRGAPPSHVRHLATGFCVCEACGQTLKTTMRSGERYYSCPTKPTGCGGVHVKAEPLEAWLMNQLLEHLTSVPISPPPVALRSSEVEATAEALRTLAQDFYVHRIVQRDEFLTSRAALVRRTEVNPHSRARRDAARVRAASSPMRALQRLDVARLRDLLDDRIDAVVVRRFVTPRRGVFDAARLQCRWRDVVSSDGKSGSSGVLTGAVIGSERANG